MFIQFLYLFQERTGDSHFEHGSLMLQYKLDNEFELVFVAGYQKILKLSYVDKFLNDMEREIRDRFRTQLADKRLLANGLPIDKLYQQVLLQAEAWSSEIAKQPKAMRTFEQSKKSTKTVASMINRPGDEKKGGKSKKPDSKKTVKLQVKDESEESENEENEVPEDGNEAEEEQQQPEETDMKMPIILPRKGQRKPGPGKFQ